MVVTKGRGGRGGGGGRGSRGGGRTGGRGHGRHVNASQVAQEPGIGDGGNTSLHPLLELQNDHRLQALIDGEPLPRLKIRHLKMPKWDSRYEPYIRESGFFGVHQIGSLPWDDDLIRALVERWRQETHTFHLPVGEMIITLEDVSILLGLPIHGTAVCGKTDRNWDQLVTDYLGVRPSGKAMANKSALSMNWLLDNFSDLEENANEDKIKKYVRAYLMCLFGSVLFVDLSGDSVSCIYLPLLADLNQVKSYAWGSAVLAMLYWQLCHGSAKTGTQVAGCLALLQIWAWERLTPFQPKLLSRHVLSGLVPETMPPRGFYWSSEHKWLESRRSLVEYRELIDALQDEDVEWTPYSQELLQNLPPSCLVDSNLWLRKAALVVFAIVETYHPERVMRQFGLYQEVPPPLQSTSRKLHVLNRQKFNKIDWSDYHSDFIKDYQNRTPPVVEEIRRYDPDTLQSYIRWYNEASIPKFSSYIGLSSDGGPARERLRRPEARFKKMVEHVIKFAHSADRKMKAGIHTQFANEAFKMCREVVSTVDSLETFERAFGQLGNVSEEEEEEGSDEVEDEVSKNEDEVEDDELNMTMTQMQSQITQQVGPSSPKRCKRELRKKK